MKKGFTLVELLGVIVIIGLLSLVVAPKITEIFSKKQNEASESFKDVLYLATREYIGNNSYLFSTGASYYCVTIRELINNGYMVEPVIDAKTGGSIAVDTNIDITIQNEQYHFEYNTERCKH